MATLNTIRTVSVRYQSEGADRFRSDADAAAASQANLAQATEQAATVSEQSARRQLSAASAYDRVRASVDANYRSQLAMERATRTVDRAMQQGVIDNAAYERTLAQIQARFATTASAADKMASAWRNLGAAGEANSRLLTPAGRLGSLSSDGSVPLRGGMGAAANQNGRRLRSDEITNLIYQGGDITAQLGSGSPLSMIALQQGPQIAQVFAGPGGASVKGAFAQARDAAAGLAARVGIVGGALGGLTTVAVAGIAAQQSYSSTQTALAQQIAGVGRASGVTVGQINALAPAAAAAGNVSVRSAREMAGEFAATGWIGSEMYVGLIGTAKDYATTTGQDLPEATKALAAAFSDPGKGAEALNRQLGFLDAATRENIQTLAAQGDRLGAQKALFDAYRASLTSATELTSGWGRMTSTVGKAISDAWDGAGRSIDRFLTGGDLETRIADLRRVLAEGPQQQTGILGLLGVGGQRGAIQAELDRLMAEQSRRQAQARQADLAQRSTAVDDLVKQFSPAQERVKQIEQSAARIRTELAAGVLDPTGESKRTAEGLESSARRIREDLAQGGTQFANAIREAQFNLRTVGFSPQAQRVAGINERAENEIRSLSTDPNDPLLRDFQVNAIRERARIEMETARQQAVYDTSSGSGRYARGLGQAPEQYRDLYYDAATRYGVNPDLLVAQGYRESRFNPRAVSPVGAEGIAQFMPGTRRGMGNFDPFDPTQAIPKQAELMAQLLRQFNGNEVAALVGYNAGPRRAERFLAGGSDVSTLPRETQDYIKAILTPPPNAEQQVRAQVERNSALDDERQKLDAANRFLDRNGEAYDAATRAQQMLSAAQASGIEITAEYRASIERNAAAMASAFRALASTQAGRGLEFDRDQLGRTRIEQASFSRARSIFGDVTSPMAQAYIGQANDNAALLESKAAVTDAMGGFVTDLRRGTDAASAFSSMLGRLADRALNGLTDSLVSGLFSAGTKGGAAAGGLGGIFASIGSLFGFANGGVMTSAGPMPLRAYSAGGIADSPQLALYGEGRMPEAYVPLPDGRRIPVAMQGGGAANSNSVTDARSFNFDMRGSNWTEEQARRMFMGALAESEARQAAALPGRVRDIQRRA
ncbi:phage tail length tape measure family protein [Methylorubrum populi]|uniref:phage tail length tape measure family protein n=1 Tax=Methylorubrum populi TaxID=223967 RepID=UPI0031F985C1